MASFLDPLLRSNAPPLALANGRSHRVVARTLLTAFDSASRKRGLLQHESLPDDTALIIAPSNAVHTFFMHFAIDVAFVSKDGRVLKVRAAVPPCRIAGAWGGFAVIELAAGALNRADTQRGDTLRVVPVEKVSFT
jgi:uncharacterized membrane protein (UPF0127 family)